MRKNLQQIQNKGPVIGAATDEGREIWTDTRKLVLYLIETGTDIWSYNRPPIDL